MNYIFISQNQNEEKKSHYFQKHPVVINVSDTFWDSAIHHQHESLYIEYMISGNVQTKKKSFTNLVFCACSLQAFSYFLLEDSTFVSA